MQQRMPGKTVGAVSQALDKIERGHHPNGFPPLPLPPSPREQVPFAGARRTLCYHGLHVNTRAVSILVSRPLIFTPRFQRGHRYFRKTETHLLG